MTKVTARAVAYMLTRLQVSRDEIWAPTFETVDHRSVGYGAVSRQDAERIPELFYEIADDVRFRVDDVLAVSPHGLVRKVTTSGMWRDGGGPFERTVCAMSVFGADGRVTRHETFDADREVEALARFDALTATAKENEQA